MVTEGEAVVLEDEADNIVTVTAREAFEELDELGRLRREFAACTGFLSGETNFE